MDDLTYKIPVLANVHYSDDNDFDVYIHFQVKLHNIDEYPIDEPIRKKVQDIMGDDFKVVVRCVGNWQGEEEEGESLDEEIMEGLKD